MKKSKKIITLIVFILITSACSNINDSTLLLDSDGLIYEEGESTPFEGLSNIDFKNNSYEILYQKGKMVSISPFPNDSDLKIKNSLIYFFNQKVPLTGKSVVKSDNLTLYQAEYIDGKLLSKSYSKELNLKNKNSSLGLEKIDDQSSGSVKLETSYFRNYNPEADTLRCKITYADQNKIWLYRYPSVTKGDSFLEHRSKTKNMKMSKIHYWEKWMGGNEFVNMRTTIWEAQCNEREGIFSGVTEEGGLINGMKHGKWIYYNDINGKLFQEEDWFHGKLIKAEKLGKSSKDLREKKKKQAEAKRKEEERKKKQAEAKRKERERQKKEQEKQKKLKDSFNDRVLDELTQLSMQFLKNPSVEKESLLLSYFEELLPIYDNKSISYSEKNTILKNIQKINNYRTPSEVFDRLLGKKSIGMFEYDEDIFKHMLGSQNFKDFAKHYMMYAYSKLNSYNSRYYDSRPENILKDYIKLYNNADKKRRNPATYTKLSLYLQKISIEIYGDTKISSNSNYRKFKKNIETEFFKNVRKNKNS